MTVDLTSAAIGILGALITGLFAYIGIVKKSKSDEAALAINAWKELVEPLKEELKETKEEVARLNKQLTEQALIHSQETAKLLGRIKQLTASLEEFKKSQNTYNKNHQ